MIGLLRWTAVLGLIGTGAYGLHLHSSIEEPAGVAIATQPVVAFDQEAAEQQLNERFELYVELRKQDDWVELYELVDPVEREQVDLRSFLAFYGHGYLKLHDLWIDGVEFDWTQGTAIINAISHAELQIDKLPAKFRVTQLDQPEDTHVEAAHNVSWVRRGGEWFFRMDNQIVTGRQTDGREVQAF